LFRKFGTRPFLPICIGGVRLECCIKLFQSKVDQSK
jgi:hypothetical protein